MERTIKITGTGSLSLQPDLMVVTISVHGEDKDYDTVLKMSSCYSNKIKDTLTNFGFSRESIKTTDFEISMKYDSYRDENGYYHKNFKGYRYDETLKLSFDFDNRLLDKILKVLNSLSFKPELELNFSIKDKEEAKNELLRKCVMNAKEKGTVIANASGVSLKEIISIDYSFMDIRFDSRSYDMRCACASTNGPSMDITPEDLTISDSVTITYRIE